MRDGVVALAVLAMAWQWSACSTSGGANDATSNGGADASRDGPSGPEASAGTSGSTEPENEAGSGGGQSQLPNDPNDNPQASAPLPNSGGTQAGEPNVVPGTATSNPPGTAPNNTDDETIAPSADDVVTDDVTAADDSDDTTASGADAGAGGATSMTPPDPTGTGSSTPDPGPSGSSTTVQVNCMPCAQTDCSEQYATCVANETCNSLITCGDACWADDDWASFDDCTLECALAAVDDANAVEIATTLTECSAAQCEESECLTRTIEDEEFDPEPEQAPIDVELADGYLTADVFHGYVWTQTDAGSSLELAAHEPGEPVCVQGAITYGPASVEAGEEYPTYARFGFNLNQALGEPPPAPETVDSTLYSGLLINDHPLSYAGALPSWLELWEPGAASDPTRRWCTTSFTSHLSFLSFRRCDGGLTGDYFDGNTPIESLVFYFRGGPATTQVNFCLYQLSAL